MKRLTKSFLVRCTEDQLKIAQRNARRRERTLGSYIRFLISKDTARLTARGIVE